MRLDSEICDMFKLEESKYNKAIENLVRTEYAKFAQDGIEKSYLETGIEEYNVLTAKMREFAGFVEERQVRIPIN